MKPEQRLITKDEYEGEASIFSRPFDSYPLAPEYEKLMASYVFALSRIKELEQRQHTDEQFEFLRENWNRLIEALTDAGITVVRDDLVFRLPGIYDLKSRIKELEARIDKMEVSLGR